MSTKCSSLKDKLRKPTGILEPYEAKELEAKLMFANKVIHKEIGAKREDVEPLIDWTEKFTERFLGGCR